MTRTIVSIGLINDKELIRKLKALTEKVQGKIARSTIGVGAKVMLSAMRQTAPRGATGNLRRSLERKTKRYRRSGITIAVVGPRLPMGAHAHLTESGTKERVVQKTGRRVGRVKAQFWMKKAFDRSVETASQRMTQSLRSRLRNVGA